MKKIKSILFILLSSIIPISAQKVPIKFNKQYNVKIAENEKNITIKGIQIDLKKPIENTLKNNGFSILYDSAPGYNAVALDNYNIYFTINDSLNMLSSFSLTLSDHLIEVIYKGIKLNTESTLHFVLDYFGREKINYEITENQEGRIVINDKNKVTLIFDGNNKFREILVYFDITKKLDQIILEKYDYSIKHDKLIGNFTTDYFTVNSQDELIQKSIEIYQLYNQWLEEALSFRLSFRDKSEQFTSPSEKYIYRKVLNITYNNLDIIRNYCSSLITKLIITNPNYVELSFVQDDVHIKYEILHVQIESMNWEEGVGPYYRIYIYYDLLSDKDEEIYLEMISKEDKVISHFSHKFFKSEEGKKLFAGSLTELDVINNLKYIKFNNN